MRSPKSTARVTSSSSCSFENALLAGDVEQRPHVGVLRGLFLLRSGRGATLGFVFLALEKAREEGRQGRGEEVDGGREPREAREGLVPAPAGDPPDDETLGEDPAEEDHDGREEPRLAHAERREGRPEAEEAAEHRALGRQAHGDAGDTDVLRREEGAEAPGTRLEERLAAKDREALERLAETGKDDVDAREKGGKEKRDAGPPDEDAGHGTPSGPSPKAERRIRRCRRNIVPSSVS